MAATVYEHKQDDYNTQDGYNMQQYKVSFSYYNVLLLHYIYLSMYLWVLISKNHSLHKCVNRSVFWGEGGAGCAGILKRSAGMATTFSSLDFTCFWKNV